MKRCELENEIIADKVKFCRRNPWKMPRIMVNPELLRQLVMQSDRFGMPVVAIDPFNRENWALFGMHVVEDEAVERWEIF